MPIYEYVCSKCGHEWDTIQKVSEKPLTACPKCGKKSAKRKISAAAFHLKGSGWYVTDYKSGGAASKEKDSGDEASTPKTDKSETKVESSKDEGPSKTPKPVTKTEKQPASKPSGRKKSRSRLS